MNRAVEEVYYSLSNWEYGIVVLYGVENHPQVYEHIQEFYRTRDAPDPSPLVKYVIRNSWNFCKEGETYQLPLFKKPKDPYGKIRFKRFTGQFIYDEEQGCFKPQFNEVEGSRWLKQAYDKIEDKRIKRRWTEVKKYLIPNGKKLQLTVEPPS